MKTLAISLIITIASIAGVSRADSGSAVSDAGVTVVAPDAGAGSAVAVGSGAGTVPTLPDPTVDPGAALSAASSDWKAYGPVWGGLIILTAIVAAFKKKNDEDHWIHNSYALTGLVVLPTALGALLTWHFVGGSLLGLLMTIGGAIAVAYQAPSPAVTK